MEESRFTISGTAIVLPVALLLCSASILYLTVQGANLATLRTENEKESARQSELSVTLKTVRDQIDPVRRELMTLTAEQARVADERKAAVQTIARASALAQTVDQLKKEETSASNRLEDLRRAQAEASVKIEASRTSLANLERKIEQIRGEKTEADSRLSDTVAKELGATQKLADRERTIAAREKVLSERDRALSERDAELAAAAAVVKRLDAQKRQLEIEIAEKRTEAKSVADQLANMDSSKVAAVDLQRLRTEKIELMTKTDQLRQDLRIIEANLKEKEDLRKRLELSIADLNVRKASTEPTNRK